MCNKEEWWGNTKLLSLTPFTLVCFPLIEVPNTLQCTTITWALFPWNFGPLVLLIMAQMCKRLKGAKNPSQITFHNRVIRNKGLFYGLIVYDYSRCIETGACIIWLKEGLNSIRHVAVCYLSMCMRAKILGLNISISSARIE